MADQIYIKSISVVKLFKRLTFDIDFENQSNVSIVIAPNGCGKTTVFNFINFLLNPSVETLVPIARIPFESFTCNLSNGASIVLIPKKGRERKSYKSDFFEDEGTEHEAISFFSEWNFILKISVPGLAEVITFDSRKEWNIKKRGILSPRREDDFEDDSRFMTVFRDYLHTENKRIIQDFYERMQFTCKQYQRIIRENKLAVAVTFISANRLNSPDSIGRDLSRYPRSRYDFLSLREKGHHGDVLNKACWDAAALIRYALDKYSKLLTMAKNELPRTYLELTSHDSTFESFSAEWKKYHSELKKYHEIGLLPEKETIIKESELESAFKKKELFLIAYLRVFEKTLFPLENVYNKIKLFSDIFRKRNEITGKTVAFSPEGIKIKVGDETLDMHTLSSGEKNDFIMFFQLIFMAPENGIVLIDEPEISLHIEWQEEYLDRLLEICQLNGLQAIVATHSPNIVNGHLDLFALREDK